MNASPLSADLYKLARRVGLADDPGVTGVRPSALDAFERRTGMTLPASVREWLAFCNGCFVAWGGIHAFLGIDTEHPYLNACTIYEMYPEWIELGWFPIAADGCGNYHVVLTTHEGRAAEVVGFIETIDSVERVHYVLASTAGLHFRMAMLEQLGELEWPFSEGAVLAIDPGIVRTGLPLPWID